jgi:calcium/calmodulin-dependent protein kinase I
MAFDVILNYRWTAAQLLEHKWVTGKEIATVQLTSALEELRRFNARRKFKAAIRTVQATNALTKAFSKSQSNDAVNNEASSPTKPAEPVSIEKVELKL